MTKVIDFYFDFISPYSFLAHKRIVKIQKNENIKFSYKPILLGGLHNLAGITAPALIKSKKNYLVEDCEMIAKKYKFYNKDFTNWSNPQNITLPIQPKPRSKKISKISNQSK